MRNACGALHASCGRHLPLMPRFVLAEHACCVHTCCSGQHHAAACAVVCLCLSSPPALYGPCRAMAGRSQQSLKGNGPPPPCKSIHLQHRQHTVSGVRCIYELQGDTHIRCKHDPNCMHEPPMTRSHAAPGMHYKPVASILHGVCYAPGHAGYSTGGMQASQSAGCHVPTWRVGQP